MKLKFLVLTLFFITFLSSGIIVVAAESAETISQARYDRICKWGILNPPECKKRIVQNRSVKKKNTTVTSKKAIQKENYDLDCKWGIFNPPKCRGNDSRVKGNSKNQSYEEEKRIKTIRSFDKKNNNLSVYTGVFDSKDEKGIGETEDDKTSLVGIEHKNTNLFRDTWIGRFSPTTGAFVTKKSSIYLYSGIEADYSLGPISISPSFAPGYYEAGAGKNLGSALEFKSEVKFGINLFENSNLGYTYSHISNNDWGDVNPGTDNQSITFSKKF